MAALITLQDAKQQLNIPLTTTERDAELQELVERASAMVLTHLKSRAVAEWSVEDPLPVDGIAVPAGVQTATRLLIGELDEHRGDEAAIDGGWKTHLIPYRDPALA